ncbi:unnamed protein product, partial [Aphanomyces euteiches]
LDHDEDVNDPRRGPEGVPCLWGCYFHQQHDSSISCSPPWSAHLENYREVVEKALGI